VTLDDLRAELRRLASPADAVHLQRFFKTGPGEYGEGDRFLGLRVPALRALVRPFRHLALANVVELLRSEWHEERLMALLLLVEQYRRGDSARRAEIFETYLANTRWINNWDVVDSSAEHIVGAALVDGDRSLLDRLAASPDLWERRIAVLATFHFIKRGEYRPTLRLAERLLGDRHDLIHKAVGWMLREVGERDREAEEAFLRRHQAAMPRTMLRYAIEKFDPPLRQWYLRGCPGEPPATGVVEP
jgi:3-methyladenine DNA glycosylase AlkD